MRVLVVNAGSSSLKLRLLGPDDELLGARDLAPRRRTSAPALDELGEADAVGHRIVHGGERFSAPVVIDDGRRRGARGADGAGAAAPAEVAGGAGRGARARCPALPAVACFDTAFHATLPAAAATYALPAAWRERWRCGATASTGSRTPGRRGAAGPGGAWSPATSARARRCAAVRDGRCVDTTMGFTPLEGLVMATRSGSVDPGLLLWLLERTGMAERELAEALEHESGLLGLAGTADMREVLAAAERGEPDATLALDVYVHRLRAGIAAMAAALGGLDALVFTGGVGERAPEVRARAAEGLAFLGVAVDPAAQRRAATRTSAPPGAVARTLVVEAREDLEIARGVRAVLG